MVSAIYMMVKRKPIEFLIRYNELRNSFKTSYSAVMYIIADNISVHLVLIVLIGVNLFLG